MARRTCLYEFHKKLGCKFTEFAGWEMPVQYTKTGVLQEHHACRKSAALFDVSHMGQWLVEGEKRTLLLERMTTIDTEQLSQGTAGLSVITTEEGGIIDDTVIANSGDHHYMVVNAGNQDKDYEHAQTIIPHFSGAKITPISKDYGLLALQGPAAAKILEGMFGVDLSSMDFMTQRMMKLGEFDVRITRCGYTGEDGFEISVPVSKCEELAWKLANHDAVTAAGLAARDSLRLEAGLCLWGNDIDETKTPIEAGLAWVISKRRRAQATFIGAERILKHLTAKPGEEGAFKLKRVGLVVNGPPARGGALVCNPDGKEIGAITSGCPSPTMGKNIAMAYVPRKFQKEGTELLVEVRGKRNTATVTKMPFVPHNYYRIA